MIKQIEHILKRLDHNWNDVNQWLNQKNRHELVVWSFLLGYLFVGYLIYDDYGVSMDEPIQRKHGMVSLEYVNRQLGEPFNIPNIYNIDVQYYDHKDYGVIFQMGCYTLELLLGLKDSRDIFLLRHALVFLLFWVSVVYFYKLLEYHFRDWRLALLGTIFLVLSPRIFANSFYNPKDIPLLSWGIICTYTMLKFLDLRNIKYAVLHGFACAIAINTRIVGVYLPILTIAIYIVERIKIDDYRSFNLPSNSSLLIFLTCNICFTVMFWPVLWSSSLSNFLYSFSSMSHYSWFNTILFMGNSYYPRELPWYYIPVWIGISTPITYIFLFAIGLSHIIYYSILNNYKLYQTSYQRNSLVFTLLFIVPLLVVIVLGSTLYNGWRHMYFIYPYIIVISLEGIKFLDIWIKKIFGNINYRIIYVVIPVFLLIEIVRIHPFQNVYFNELITGNNTSLFDLDYYGLSFKQALEELLKEDLSDSVLVSYSGYHGLNNSYILPYKDRKRLVQMSVQESTYFITNFQYNLQNEQNIRNGSFPYNQQLMNKILLNGVLINGTYKIQLPK